MNITAAVVPSLWAVRLEATGATGQVDWYRRRLGRDTKVGSTQGDGVLFDYMPELNVTYDYTAVDDTGSDSVPGVIVPADGPVLSSTTSAIAHRVTVVRIRPFRVFGRSVAHDILGRTDPVVTIHPSTYPEFDLQLLLRGAQDRDTLLPLLELGEPLVIRSNCPDRVPTRVFIMREAQDPYINDDRRDYPAYLDISAIAVTESPGLVGPDPDRTYQSVIDQHTTYQGVLDSYPTYRALLDGPA